MTLIAATYGRAVPRVDELPSAAAPWLAVSGIGRTIADMSDSIFVVGDDGSLTEAPSTAYNAEAELQELLAANIHLLPGVQIDRDNPRRWLLIKREAGVPNREGGGGSWSIDHLAVDQDAVPTFETADETQRDTED